MDNLEKGLEYIKSFINDERSEDQYLFSFIIHLKKYCDEFGWVFNYEIHKMILGLPNIQYRITIERDNGIGCTLHLSKMKNITTFKMGTVYIKDNVVKNISDIDILNVSPKEFKNLLEEKLQWRD